MNVFAVQQEQNLFLFKALHKADFLKNTSGVCSILLTYIHSTSSSDEAEEEAEESLANTRKQILHVGRQLRWFLAKDIEELGEDILRAAIPGS
jgi:hypothetical protein